MKIEMKYKGRSFSSTKAMFDAMTRDTKKEAEEHMARQARLSGMSVRRTHRGLEARGTQDQLDRFKKKLK